MGYNVEEDLEHLITEMKRLQEGTTAEGNITVKFITLFKDDRCANLFEALAGTLKAAKKRKVIDFEGELLLQGMSDNTDIVLLKTEL
ncbi:costars family protein WS02710_H03 [Sphaeroforma arctica JP610]|uniref:Costars family protein WS02710_H03 n=1 Tax=Sphaeroforma arctica JP610 TaxID=667725 RepID=A0A0L0GA55_9EUKA|nr:costars family protein WS02710_H03 [Sphaeroforma arctica JP610]KNC85118.1 costars family protein WS02710_H03 [Sphaeroforma arctica JP610]|eukprot:XP_014159020.1 costars family protein WS02710_H03 [Sphaeroforma arctica JP610]